MPEKHEGGDYLKIAAAFLILFLLAIFSPFIPIVGMVTIVPWLIWKSIKK